MQPSHCAAQMSGQCRKCSPRSVIHALLVAAMELTAIPGWNVIAMDQSLVAVQTAHARMDSHGSHVQRAYSSFRKARISQTNLPSASVDVVLAFNVLSQVPDLRAALQEVQLHSMHGEDDCKQLCIKNNPMLSDPALKLLVLRYCSGMHFGSQCLSCLASAICWRLLAPKIPSPLLDDMQVHRILKQDGVLVFGVMNRSLRTWLSLYWHTEFQRDMPKQAFDWRLGITPEEMKAYSEEAGLNMVHEELQGVCESMEYFVHWERVPWVLQARHAGMYACKDVGKHYLGWAYKHPAAESAGGQQDFVQDGDDGGTGNSDGRQGADDSTGTTEAAQTEL
jgi:hypothetical protein